LSAFPGFAPATPATPATATEAGEDEDDPDEPDRRQPHPQLSPQSHPQPATIFPVYDWPDDQQAGSKPVGSSDLEPIPLPEARSDERTRRRKELRRRRRKRIGRGALVLAVVAVVTGLIALLAAPVGRLVERGTGNRNAGNRNPESREAGSRDGAVQSAAPQPVPTVAPVLLAYQDAAGRASALTILVPSASGKGGTLVLVPPGTMAEVVSLGLEPVRQSLELGGPTRLQATVENLLGAPLGGVVVVDDAGLANLLAPTGPFPVTVPERVERVSPNGRVEVLYEAGATTLAPAGAGRFLSAKGRENDLSRLTRHQAFWEAWLARLGARPAAVPSRSTELNAAIAALAAGSVDTRLLPVEAFGTAGDGGELYKVRGDELSRLVAGVFPSSAGQGLAGRPRVQVLNGTGALEVADAVRAKLGAGYDVRLTGNAANFEYERTEIVFYDRDQEAVADRLRQALGVGALVLSRRPLDVVDVTVIVGKDFRP
jgi:hypothetical protein